MAQSKTKNDSTTVCDKIRGYISGNPAMRAMRRVSQGSTTSRPTSNPQIPMSKLMVKSAVPPTKPLVLSQPSPSTEVTFIPIEFDDSPFSQPALPNTSALKKGQVTNSATHPKEEKTEIKVGKGSAAKVVAVQIGGGHGKGMKPSSKTHETVQERHQYLTVPQTGTKDEVVSHKKREEKKAGTEDEDKFSAYITDVRTRMVRTMTNRGGGGGGGGGAGSGGARGENSTAIPTKRVDSVNYKATNYINRAKAKIRATTNLGVSF